MSESPLRMDGQAIQPQSGVKILGIIMDQELRFKQHIARAAKRGTNAALALKRIKGMTPKNHETTLHGDRRPSAGLCIPDLVQRHDSQFDPDT
jgi:hypothetical protein